MIREINLLIDIEKKFYIKTIHNKFKIIKVISENKEIASMEICKITGRSISAHNADLKRLSQLGLITSSCSDNDKRKRIYSLSPLGEALFAYFTKNQKSLDAVANL